MSSQIHSRPDYLSEVWAGFAAPTEPFHQDFVETWAVATTKSWLMALAERAVATPGHHEVSEVLVELASRVSCFQDVWRPEFGVLQRVIQHAPAELARATTELALVAHQKGVDGRWSVAFEEPDSFWAGQLLPPSIRLEVAAYAGRVRIDGVGADGSAWSVTLDGTPAAPSESPRYPPIVPFPVRSPEDGEGVSGPLTGEEARHLKSGMDLLDGASPRYATWVRRMVWGILPLQCRGTVVASWSSLDYPGLLAISLFDSPTDMAETLVHEASHQYLHLLQRFGDLVDPKDRNLYYSPVKRTGRPLEKLLVAYHAFANVSALFGDFRTAGVFSASDYEYHQSDLVEWLPELARNMDESGSLTELGYVLLRAFEKQAEGVGEPRGRYGV